MPQIEKWEQEKIDSWLLSSFVNALMSSPRDIKVFTKKQKDKEGVGEKGTPLLIQSE